MIWDIKVYTYGLNICFINVNVINVNVINVNHPFTLFQNRTVYPRSKTSFPVGPLPLKNNFYTNLVELSPIPFIKIQFRHQIITNNQICNNLNLGNV